MTGKTSLAGHFRCAVTLGVDFDGPSHAVSWRSGRFERIEALTGFFELTRSGNA